MADAGSNATKARQSIQANGQHNASAGRGRDAGKAAAAAPAPPSTATSSNNSAFAANAFAPLKQPPNINHFSESTQALLKRVGQQYNFSTDSPEWEKAREEVMKRMSATSSSPFPTVIPKTTTASSTPGSVRQDTKDTSLATPKRGRGRPPGRATGRPRGSFGTARPKSSRGASLSRGKGARRKQDEDGDESDSGSDVSASYTPQATHTKSGRNINKPTQFVPPAVEVSPSTGSKRKRPYIRKNAESSQLCAKCSRGHSPASNVVVFCDGCNLAYHQWCHDPHIPREVIDIAEKEWFCGRCQGQRELERLPINQRVSGDSLTEDERKRNLSSLAHSTLVRLLLRATTLHKDLPIYAPDAREHLGSSSSSLSPVPNHANGPVVDDPYPDYSNPNNDPPATYPRPGTGPIPLQPTTDPERIQWLVDDNFDVYSHSYDDGNGQGLRPVDRSKGDHWIQHVGNTPKREPNAGVNSATNGQVTGAGPATDAPRDNPQLHAMATEHELQHQLDAEAGVVDIDMQIFDSNMS